MIFGRKRTQKNDMDQEYEEYDDRYDEGEEDFEVDPPMSEIRHERDRTLNNPRNNHRVNLRKYRGRGWTRKHERGLPKREKSAPINRTRDKSPFSYEAGLTLSRKNSQKRKSLGVPWKR